MTLENAAWLTDGTRQRIDFRPVLHGALLGPLRDLAKFNAVTLDSEVGTLTWPNGADFDPAVLHDWPTLRHEFAARAETWTDAPSGDARANVRVEPPRH